jgi:hypothetical protein
VLADPFSPTLDPVDPPLDGKLQQHLQGRVGSGTAANHARLANQASKALEDTIGQDLQELSKTKEAT